MACQEFGPLWLWSSAGSHCNPQIPTLDPLLPQDPSPTSSRSSPPDPWPTPDSPLPHPLMTPDTSPNHMPQAGADLQGALQSGFRPGPQGRLTPPLCIALGQLYFHLKKFQFSQILPMTRRIPILQSFKYYKMHPYNFSTEVGNVSLSLATYRSCVSIRRIITLSVETKTIQHLPGET